MTQSGLLFVDKPKGPTSHDIVDEVRRLTGIRKVGHGGTLDPLASGLMLIAIGPATKLLSRLSGLPKRYLATIRLGATTPSDDRESELTLVSDRKPTQAELEHALEGFRGQLLQAPPDYSARKQSGQRAYRLARRGEPVALEPRPVTVSRLDLVSYDYPDLTLDLTVSAGTYIRSIARDLGSTLTTGGYLLTLRRTEIGTFNITEAIKLENQAENWVQKVLEPQEVLLRLSPQSGKIQP